MFLSRLFLLQAGISAGRCAATAGASEIVVADKAKGTRVCFDPVRPPLFIEQFGANKMYVGATPQTRAELKEVLTAIFFGAPDDFFQLPNTLPGEEYTLEGMTERMRLGIAYVFRAPRHQEATSQMLISLNEIYSKFRSGDVSGGRIQCHALRDLISAAPR